MRFGVSIIVPKFQDCEFQDMRVVQTNRKCFSSLMIIHQAKVSPVSLMHTFVDNSKVVKLKFKSDDTLTWVIIL